MESYQPSINMLSLAIKKYSSMLCSSRVISLTTLITLGFSTPAMATLDIISGSVDNNVTSPNNNYYLNKVNASQYNNNIYELVDEAPSKKNDYYTDDNTSSNNKYYMDDSTSSNTDDDYYANDSNSYASSGNQYYMDNSTSSNTGNNNDDYAKSSNSYASTNNSGYYLDSDSSKVINSGYADNNSTPIPSPNNSGYYLDSDSSKVSNSGYADSNSTPIPSTNSSGYYLDSDSSKVSNSGYYTDSSSSAPSPNSSGYYLDSDSSKISNSSYNQSSYGSYNSYDTSSSYNSYGSYGQSSLFDMYSEYDRLSGNISMLDPSTVINFSQRYPKTVLGEKLVADFAENKARNYDYNAVQQVTPYITNADKSEACAIGIGDSQKGNSTRLRTQKAKTWLNTLKQPSLCDQFATTLNNTRVVNNTDRLNRLYRMLRKGKTTDIVSLASSVGTSLDYSELQNLQFSQSRFFNDFNSQGYSQRNQFLYLYAIGRLTSKSYREAQMQLQYDISQDNARSSKLLSEQTRRMAYRSIAVKRMNMNTTDGFNQEVVTWFRNSLGEPFNYEEAEDYAMAGIRFSNWQDVIKAINAMEQTKRNQDVWTYWLARSYEQLGQSSKAQSLYRTVAQRNNYYGYLAKDKLGQSVDFSAMKANSRNSILPTITQNQRDAMLKNETFARAFALYRSGEKTKANREWNWGVRQSLKDNDFKLLLAAARHADDMGWYGRSIYAMEQANKDLNKFDLDVSYPMPRKDTVVRYSNSAGIDPAWAYGIMRQESRFNPSARSHVGAGGLMQIMPATGKYIARKLGERYNASKIANGDSNIRYGTWYMGDVLDKLDNQPVLATAGYNAGPNRAIRWKPDYRNLSADQYIETIPFPETRDYVKHVMENSTVYGYLLGRPTNISQRIGTIYP